MKRIQLIICIIAVLIGALSVFFVLKSESALITHPKGIIAKSELSLIATNYLLMLIIVIPTFILLFTMIWKYRASNVRGKYDPEHRHGFFTNLLLWVIPSLLIGVMIVITWKETHRLDPYRPLESDVEPLLIQVVALDWKWLFIYPEQGIASVNFVQFPDQTPIHFTLAADGSPMNSFWIPELSGQIYAMAGMITQLHVMADGPGVYSGRAAEINGEGFADMTFVAKSSSESDFSYWVSQVKNSPLHLTDEVYDALLQSSFNNPVTLYSHVEEGLFHTIVMKYMAP